ncbi:Membrane-associated zinc metalloprotease [Aequoribacter fuscus]|uniref:Zinc metalloprotease n=1 Tax=Aequoribacter fuscus TaxID=2518989 RepID=F3KYQ0_9GAMM|nr:RIP metalloprotease RseP [Aequoribacter fuscus]EGG30814.1 Membrane-associated zinc metalloprotease [Aequoribacter fuscus]
MFDIIQTVFMLAVTLGIVVTVNEFGHFWVARRCGVKVLKFSVGFGRSVWSRQAQDGVEYAIGVLPLGGYVKMLDEREAPVDADLKAQAFNNKSPAQRIAIAAAGPMFNFILAIIVYFVLFLAGERGLAPVIGSVEPGSIAEMAGLESDQEIVAIDGQKTLTWQAVNFALLERLGDSGTIEFSVIYPPSQQVYSSQANLDRWLAGAEDVDLIRELGIEPYRPVIPAIIGGLADDGAAMKAGLQVGDEFVSIDGSTISDWMALVEEVKRSAGQERWLGILRDGLPLTVAVQIEAAVVDGDTIGRLGVYPAAVEFPVDMVRYLERGPIESLAAALERTGALVVFTLDSMKKMVEGLISPKNLSGPITIAKVATATAERGWASYFEFIALLSVSLGVLNLLPIPVLDGGHILYYAIEWIAGRPVPERVQIMGYQIGLFLVTCLMVFALYNDVARLG